MKQVTILVAFFVFVGTNLLAQPPNRVINHFVNEINEIRTKGCRCGGKKMQPVGKIVWSDHLYATAASHASEMEKYKFFSHFSRNGDDIGDRFDDFDYPWRYAGENLGEGQDTFEEVVKDWLESPSHCKMIMNVNMKEMGIAKRGRYWVQHFGTKMPPNHRRTSRKYTEGN